MRIYVDGSYSKKKPDVVGWGFKEEGGASVSGILRGDISTMHQIGGEIFASLSAINHAIRLKQTEVTILYDYLGVEHWATGKWSANNKYTQHYANEIKKMKQKINIKFKKIDAGLNEADELARKGTGAAFAH
jgi:ribonuclease HI